ncbi:hypothetical protein NH288_04995 [Anaerococcus sp. NML200537]|uniref:hypothetical protein n=1 Tax=Anaerococcus sp. NML200537 TaxID=2954485 RepID=UPI002237E4BF|nr:hypothetical protein [Anaerococcus sp. NML200537]MCW6701440.1 hypothetical protein [Anaerococcus sp. NML200537]
MAIYRTAKESNYTVVDNGFISDPNLSWKAKGILLYLLSLPCDWNINLNEVQRHATDGIKSLRTGIKELTDAGYTKRQPVRDENGVFKEWETIIFEKKQVETIENSPFTPYPQVDKPQVDNPQVEKGTLLNTNNTNNLNILSTKDISKQTKEKDEQTFKKEIMEEWNKLGEPIKNIQALNPGTSRYKHTKARIKEFGKEKVIETMRTIDSSKFLKGHNTYNWVVSFDWFIKPVNFAKVLEGRYTNEAMGLVDNSTDEYLASIDERMNYAHN